MQQPHPRIHHAEPLVVARQIFSLLSDNISEPLLDLGMVHIVVVDPPLVSGVVRGIDIDALDLAFVLRKQALQGLQIVSVDNPVLPGDFRVTVAVLLFKRAIGHVQVMVDDFVFSDPVKCRHAGAIPSW